MRYRIEVRLGNHGNWGLLMEAEKPLIAMRLFHLYCSDIFRNNEQYRLYEYGFLVAESGVSK